MDTDGMSDIEPEPREPVITVMTANLWNGLASDAQVIQAIRSSGADVIGLEELNRRQANVIEDAASDLYPWISTFGDSYEGRGVLSRLPLVSVELVHLVADRPDVLAVVDTGSILLSVIVGHPRPQLLRRGRVRFQMSSLRQILRLGRLARERSPAVLLGDFNMSPRHPGYNRFEKLGLTDAYVAGGDGTGRTFPIRMRVTGTERDPDLARIISTPPLKRFDHIWHTSNIRTEQAWIGPDSGSDHASVIARLILPAGSSRSDDESDG
jgi:endonuclease/exonuclease/phosphatase (EEP) superfamily protein YafD